MKAQKILDNLEMVAKELSVKVSYEALASVVGGGGICRVKGEYRIIVDKRSSLPERISTLARCLSTLDTVEIEMPRPVRETLDFYSMRKAG